MTAFFYCLDINKIHISEIPKNPPMNVPMIIPKSIFLPPILFLTIIIGAV